MKVKKIIGSLAVLLLLAALVLPTFAVTAPLTLDVYAKSPDPSVTHADFIPGVPFDLYYVAAYNEDSSQFVLQEPFGKWNLDTTGMYDPATAQKAWIEQAESCGSYIVGQGIAPTASKTADETGHARFANMQTGLYLIHGTKTQIGDYIFECGTFFVTVTEDQIELIGGAPVVQIIPKFSKIHVEPEPDPEYMDIRVTKVWKNDNSRVRPTALRVRLFRNGEVYDTVVLNKDNNWEYVWRHIEKIATDEWTVCEEYLSGYTMHLKRNVLKDEIHFIFTNTYNPPYNPPDPPDPPSPPDTPEPPPPEEKLIETGANWTLPVVLAGFGILLLVCGQALRRKAE